MTAKVFVDSNVLAYARDTSEGEKQRRSIEWMGYLWRSKAGRVSVEVLQEFYLTVTRKPLAPTAVRADVRELMAWHPTTLDTRILEGAFEAEDRHKLSFWDALIVPAARAAGCEYLLTEDLQDGQSLDGLVVVDPFLHEPGSLLREGRLS